MGTIRTRDVGRASATTLTVDALVTLGRRQAALAQTVLDRVQAQRGETGPLIGLRAALDQLQATVRHGDRLAVRIADDAAPSAAQNRTGR